MLTLNCLNVKLLQPFVVYEIEFQVEKLAKEELALIVLNYMKSMYNISGERHTVKGHMGTFLGYRPAHDLLFQNHSMLL